MNRFHTLAYDIAWDFGWWRGCYIRERARNRNTTSAYRDDASEWNWRGRSETCLAYTRLALAFIRNRRIRREIGAKIAVAIRKGSGQ